MDYGKFDYNNIVITGFNNFKDFFSRGLNLIASLHRTSYNSFDQIFIFNLGFDDTIKQFLNSLDKVTVLDFPEYLTQKHYPDFLVPKLFAWKCYAMWVAKDLGKNILWLDAGIAPIKDIKPVFDIIQNEDYFFVTLDYPLTNKNWTTPLALELMNATEKEINDFQVSTNIYGYKAYSSAQAMFDQGFEYAKVQNIMDGDKRVHRSEQSVFSILASRNECKRYPLHKYAEPNGILSDEQLLYAHRGQFYNLDGLKFKKDSEISVSVQLKVYSLYLKLKSKRKIRIFGGKILRFFKII